VLAGDAEGFGQRDVVRLGVGAEADLDALERTELVPPNSGDSCRKVASCTG
jgi:hypothetical protein